MTQTTNTPKVSVVMATYNRAHLLPQAIDSIRAQTLTDWELIIVDDASTDNTPEVVRAFTQQDKRIRYHRHQHNSGLAVARNTSVGLARGRYIALQDDDDISLPHRLHKQARFLDRNPSIHLVGVWLRCFDSDGLTHEIAKTRWTSVAQHPPDLSDCWSTPMASPCLMARRHVFIETPMRPFFRFAEDYDFLLRCIARYNLSHIPQILYHYRSADVHHQSITTNTLASWQYHCLAWACAYHRYKGWDDPIVNAPSIDDALKAIHPQFKTQASDGIKKLTEEFRFYLLETKQPKAIEDTKTFISHFADKQLAQKFFRQSLADYLSTMSSAFIKSRLHHSIRHHERASYLAILRAIHQFNPHTLRVLAIKIVFACLRRRRFSFILPLIKTLLQIKK